jgi:hypothetical protein
MFGAATAPPGLIKRSYPTRTTLFGDGGYAGRKLVVAVAHVDWLTIEIIRRFAPD